jgi:hypothetical protein
MISTSQSLTDFLKDIFFSSDEKKQLGLLKVWPAMRLKDKLVNVWLKYYVDICEQQQKASRLLSMGSLRLTSLKSSKLGGSFIGGDAEITRRKTRLINFLILGLSYNFLDNESKDTFRILDIMKKHNEDSGIINTIKLSVIKFKTDPTLGRNSISARTVTEIMTFKKEEPAISSRPKLESVITDIIQIPPKELACYLTHHYSQILKNVSMHEYLYMALHDECNKEYIPNLIKMIEEFTKISYLIPSDILLKRKDKRERVKFIKYILKVATETKDIGNYHAFFAIIAGLNHVSVRRIKTLWKEGSKSLKHLTELEDIISMTSNFIKYRTLLKKSPRAIPYIGLLTSDLKHLLEKKLILDDGLCTITMNCTVYDKFVAICEEFDEINKVFILPTSSNIDSFMTSQVICTNDDVLYDLSQSLQQSKGSSLNLSYEDKSSQLHKTDTRMRSASLEETSLLHRGSISVSLGPNTSESLKLKEKLVEPISGIKTHTDINIVEPLLSSRRRTKHLSLKLDLISGSEKKTKSLTIVPLPTDNFESIKDMCVETWDNNHVLLWLTHIGFREYSEYFFKEDITGATLPELTDHHLKNELKVDKLGHRLKILKAISGLRSLHK